MRAPLLDDGFCLEQITPKTRLDELEFHFPVSQVDALKALPFLDRHEARKHAKPQTSRIYDGKYRSCV